MRVLFQEQDPHHTITVYDTFQLYGERGSFRVLQFADGAVQGALDLQNPRRVVLEYPRAIIHLMEYNHTDFENAFIIGHGIGTIGGYFPGKGIKTAELDPAVAEVSRQYFGCSQEHILIGDGRLLLEQEKARSMDYIIVDAFTHKGTPKHLVSSDFFGLAAQKLEHHGTMMLNLAGKGEHDPHINAIHTTLAQHFPYTRAFVLPSASILHNIVLTAGGKPLRFQAKQMAGFKEYTPGEGYMITD